MKHQLIKKRYRLQELILRYFHRIYAKRYLDCKGQSKENALPKVYLELDELEDGESSSGAPSTLTGNPLDENTVPYGFIENWSPDVVSEELDESEGSVEPIWSLLEYEKLDQEMRQDRERLLHWAERFEEYDKEALLSIPIEEIIVLPASTYNCLKRAKLLTVGEIASHSQKWLLRNVRNLRRKQVDHLAEILEELGVELPRLMETDTPFALEELERMTGLSRVKERMWDMTAHCFIRSLKHDSHGAKRPIVPNMLFLGNPGTGKTTVAKLTGKLLNEIGLMEKGHLVSVTRADLVGRYLGETAQKTTEVFLSALDGILFVDEAYSLCEDRGYGYAGDLYGNEAISTLSALMSEHEGRCCVIFAGYHREMMRLMEEGNPGLRERFPMRLDFDDYDAKELEAIFLKKLQDQTMQMEEGCTELLTTAMERICSNKSRTFANARSANNFFQDVVLHQERRLYQSKRSGADVDKCDLFTLTCPDFLKAMESIPNAAPPALPKRAIGFQAVEDRCA